MYYLAVGKPWLQSTAVGNPSCQSLVFLCSARRIHKLSLDLRIPRNTRVETLTEYINSTLVSSSVCCARQINAQADHMASHKCVALDSVIPRNTLVGTSS